MPACLKARRQTPQRVADVAVQFLCEVCFDTLTTHMTAAWNGIDIAVCEDCLAPPAGQACWQALAEAYSGIELCRDEHGQDYLVRLRNGATIHFRWGRPLRSRRMR
jgi:hypothetical protein